MILASTASERIYGRAPPEGQVRERWRTPLLWGIPAVHMANRGESQGAAVFRAGLHPMSCAGGVSLAAFVCFVGGLIIRHNDLPAATDLRIAAGTVILAAGALAGPLLRLYRSEVVVTPAQLRVRLGAWRSRVTEMPLREVQGLEVRSGALGRRLDFGTLAVASRDDDMVLVPHVQGAIALRDAIRRAVGRR